MVQAGQDVINKWASVAAGYIISWQQGLSEEDAAKYRQCQINQLNEAQIAEGFSNPFTEADANADGLLDVEEHIVFHHKLFEYKKANGIPVPDTTKYPREQHVNFFNVLNSINPETDGVSLAEYLSYYRKVADEIDAKRVAFVSLSNAARSEGEEMFAWWQALSEEDKVKF